MSDPRAKRPVRPHVVDESESSTIIDGARTAVPEGTGTTGFVVAITAGSGAGGAIALDGTSPSRVLVGQAAGCDLRLNDAKVSRRHLALEVAGSRLRVTDLDSTNGTFVGRLQIGEALLSGGETIYVGDTTLTVRATNAHAAPPPSITRFEGLLGASAEMRRLYPLCAKLAASDIPVLIEGETGTGKEVLAESLHLASGRRSGPFVVFDCTAVPPTLLESALFGHEKGAFTGALTSRTGAFERAHRGTLLIDELGELGLSLQPLLLRALERSEIQRVGSDRWTKVDVRVLAATRRDLEREVQAGRFRDDLLYRLAVGRIELPPLRRRKGDIAVLAAHFWEQLGGALPIPDDLVARFVDAPWPGNVRQLRNAIARCIALGELATDEGVVTAPEQDASVIEESLDAALGADLPFSKGKQLVVEEYERRYVERALRAHNGNIARAAAASGIAMRYFQLVRARRLKPT